MKPFTDILSRYQSWLIALLLSLGLIWIFANRVAEAGNQLAAVSQPYEGFTAPDFDFTDSSGNIVKLSDLRGQPVILNFWASWCPPCRAEMPAIQSVHQVNQAQGLVILGVNATDQDSIEQVQEFSKDLQLTFPILYDSSGVIQSLYNVTALPSTFFIDRSGIIQEVIIGGPIAEALLEINAKQILEEKP